MKFLIIITLFSLLSCGQKSPTKESLQSGNDSTNQIANAESDSKTSHKPDTFNKSTTASKVEIASNWELESGWFPDKNLKFKRTNEEDYVFIFKKDGTLDYRTSKGFGDCPTGAFTLRDGKWTKEGENLTLELRGLKIADYWYWWKVQYRITELTADDLKLEVIKVIKSKEIDPTLKWEDLLK